MKNRLSSESGIIKLFVLLTMTFSLGLNVDTNICAAQTGNESLVQLKQIAQKTNIDSYSSFLNVIDLTKKSVEYLISSASLADDIDNTAAKEISQCYKSIAAKNAKFYKNKIQDLQRQRDELMRQKDENITKIASLNEELSSYNNEKIGFESRLNQLYKDEVETRNDINSYGNQLDEITDAINECNNYCWVPFYGVYACAKAIEAEKKRPDIIKLFNGTNELLANQLAEKSDFNQQLKSLTYKIDSVQQQIYSYSKKQNECVNKINAVRKKLITTDNIAVYFGKQAGVFTYIEDNPNKMLEELTKSRNELKKLGEF